MKLSDMEFGIVTNRYDRGGEVFLTDSRESLLFHDRNQIDAAELPEYEEPELSAHSTPEAGDVIVLVEQEIVTLRWTWPNFVLKTPEGRFFLETVAATQSRQGMRYPGLHVAYCLKSLHEEDLAVFDTCGYTRFLRHPAYVGFHLNDFLARHRHDTLAICRYDIDRQRLVRA